jgi:copper chaperone CopZ
MQTNSTRNLMTAIALILIGATSMFARENGLPGDTKGGNTRTDTISVPDMQCEMCEKRITGALEKVAGVSSVSADAEAKQVVVTYDPKKITLRKIEKKIAAVGYDAGETTTTAASRNALPACCRPGGKH